MLAASSSSGNGLEISFDFGNNFATGAQSIQITELDIRATPGMTTGLNSNPPPPELRPVHAETAFCQRYYFRRSANGAQDVLEVQSAFNASSGWGKMFNLPVTMRTSAPVVGVSSASHLSLFESMTPYALTSITPTADSSAVFNWTPNQAVILYFNNASGWIDVSAEL
jgi:hypothetical protein